MPHHPSQGENIPNKGLGPEVLKNSYNSKRKTITTFFNGKGLNREFTKEKHMSSRKFIRKMKIKSTVRSTSCLLEWLMLKRWK